jgi:hypothetical protein
MIPLAGLSTQVGLSLVDATRDRQLELIEKEAQHARAIGIFRERIGKVETVDELMADRDLYVFVMKAFDLEDQIFGKALIEKMLKSNIDDPSGLVNRLTDPRFREMHETLAFGPDGVGNLKTLLFSWQDDMVDRYIQQEFKKDQTVQNAAIGTVLNFRKKAPEVNSVFDILKDKELSKFMRKALGLPEETVRLDIDKQAELIKSRFDLEKLKDPAEREKLERKFVALTDALDTSRLSGNAAVQLMNGAISAGAGGQFVPVTLDITAISSIPGNPYG